MKFELDEKQVERFKVWEKEIALKGVETQKQRFKDEKLDPDPIYIACWELGFPYTGAIGGETTFEFTPTSLGVICVVKDSVTEEELNLTDYDLW